MEFHVAPTALFHTFKCCSVCRSTTGPFIDTSVEDLARDRIYLCASCVRLSALTLGLLDGTEHDTVLRAKQLEGEAQQALVQMTGRRDKVAAELREVQKKLGAANTALDWHKARVDQLEHAITEDARARLALVGDEAA